MIRNPQRAMDKTWQTLLPIHPRIGIIDQKFVSLARNDDKELKAVLSL
jgi:hypothetical protein